MHKEPLQLSPEKAMNPFKTCERPEQTHLRQKAPEARHTPCHPRAAARTAGGCHTPVSGQTLTAARVPVRRPCGVSMRSPHNRQSAWCFLEGTTAQQRELNWELTRAQGSHRDAPQGLAPSIWRGRTETENGPVMVGRGRASGWGQVRVRTIG